MINLGLRSHRERGQLQAPGHRTDNNTHHTLLIINEANDTWVIHDLGAPGVRLTRDVMVTVAESILKRAR
ncbi:MAG: hypothetical protein ACRDRQ_23045 [Pseudonocardiaceae bacterium]